MTEKRAAFLPFHALNEFMTDDYRLEVVRAVLNQVETLSEQTRLEIDRQTKDFVTVPGFRNSAKAPSSLRLKPSIRAFEKNPRFTAAIVSAWAELHSHLRAQVYDLLVSLGWEILPADDDRTKIPGFLPSWPAGQDFDMLNSAFVDKYPDAQVQSNDISLMAVWLGGRLPFPNSPESP